MLLNLLSNSIKVGPSGSIIKVTSSLKNMQDQVFIEVSVCDEGDGLSKIEQLTIFK